MSEKNAASVSREVVAARLDEKLKDTAFRQRYELWTNLGTTKEIAMALREVFCRPTFAYGELNGEAAIYCQGLTEGAWSVLDAMMNTKVAVPEPKEAEVNYGVEDNGEEKNKGA